MGTDDTELDINYKAVCESIDWIYGYINNVRRCMGVDASWIGARIFIIHFTAKDLAKDITGYWIGDANKATRIREEIEYIFDLLDEIAKRTAHYLSKDDARKHKERLLGIVSLP